MEVACVGNFDVSVSVTGIEMYFENKWLLLLAAVLAVLLEIWLARGERWWPGLLLPGAVLLWTVGGFLMSYGMARAFLEKMGISGLMLVRLLVRNNLLTLALLAVYALCRWRRRRIRRRERELDKTRVDDL